MKNNRQGKREQQYIDSITFFMIAVMGMCVLMLITTWLK
mgnify:FL=1|tara:strand:+ start:354 stop:470 length:117 start_codon:yes stop_codon:yes gene_type:complete